MAHTRSEGTGETPRLQRHLEERERRRDADSQRLLNMARAYFVRVSRTPFPAEALEVE